jgi:hypothetical protein
MRRGARALLTLAAIGVFAAMAGPSDAQQMQGCEDHAQIRKRLEIKYQEALAAVATNQYGWLIELYVSADGKSWTLVGTRPNGPACVFGVGIDWQMVAPIAGAPM